MKRTFLLTAIAITLFVSCSKDEEKEAKVPTVQTTEVVDILSRSVHCNCQVVSDNGFAVIEKGACWSTSPDPTIANQKTNDGSGANEFQAFVENLEPGTKYYIRAYAKNSEGVGYGNNLTFTTDYEIGQSIQGGVILGIGELGQGHIKVVVIAENDLPDTLAFADAIVACENLTLNGYNDWRLIESDDLPQLSHFCLLNIINSVNILFDQLYWSTNGADPWYFSYNMSLNDIISGAVIPGDELLAGYVRPCRSFEYTETD